MDILTISECLIQKRIKVLSQITEVAVRYKSKIEVQEKINFKIKDVNLKAIFRFISYLTLQFVFKPCFKIFISGCSSLAQHH